MQENKVSIKISKADMQAVIDAITIINQKLGPNLKVLSTEERKHLPKMSDGTLPFVQKALEYAKANPKFVPVFIDVDELQIDVEAADALLQVQHPLNQISQTLNDTIMLCGSEAYIAALAFYSNIKQAVKMKEPGAEAICNDLSERFKGQGKKKTEPIEPSK